MDPITRLPDDIDSDAESENASRPADLVSDPAIPDIPAELVTTDEPADAETQPFQSAQSPAPVELPSPSSFAGTPAKRLVPDDMAALHPKGGYIAMRLLSRMQTDLAVLTGDKRPATYEEVEEYLGHALVAEGVAPRGYTAEQAAKWWAMGGSAALRAPVSGAQEGDGSIATDASHTDGGEALEPVGRNVLDDGASGQAGNGGSGDPDPGYPADDSDDAAVNTAASEASDAPTMPGAASTAENASEALADPTPSTPSATGTKVTQAASAKAATGDAIARAKRAIAAAKAIVKMQSPAPLGDDVLKRFGGFGGQKYSFGNDYRTTPQMRAWLPPGKPDIRYPDGLQIDEKKSPAERQRIRDYVAFLYTLPEVKALLDVVAHNEGADKLGYYLSHGANPPKLPDLNSFRGGNAASGRYQIEPGPWQNFGQKLWSRSEFSPITQDMIAITQLYQSHAIDALMNGDLSSALTLASGVFASIHVSVEEDHSRYGYRDTGELQGREGPSQPFQELPAEFAKHLAVRRAEFRQAEQAWKANKTLPWAFIPPTQWDAFGIKGFPIPKTQ